MNTVPQTAPKVARVRRKKPTYQLDFFEQLETAPIPESPATRFRGDNKYIFGIVGDKPVFVKCSRCAKFLPISMFSAETKRPPYGISHYCGDCRLTYSRAHYKRAGSLEAMRNRHLKRNYGITLDEYDLLLKEQGGVCAICHTDVTNHYGDKKRSLAIDHCHKTGKIRGILCHGCNVAIGSMREDTGRLLSAVSYLKLHSVPDAA